MNAPKRAVLGAAEPTPSFLPYGRQSIDEADIAAVAAVLRSDFLTTGPAVEAFERAFAETVDAPYAIACSSGTAALHLAMLALGIGPGDAVIVPTITFLATANAARFCGADVIFADVDPQTALMTPRTLRDAFDRAGRGRVKAVVAVHFAGSACDLPALAAMAYAHGAVLVDDACHALGTRQEHDIIGDARESVMSVFSFHPVKTIAAGEGGMVTTRDPALAMKLLQYRAHGIVRDESAFVDSGVSADVDGAPAPWAYEMQTLGYNYRLSDIHAALGASQLKKLTLFRMKRRALWQGYEAYLAPLAPLVKLMPMSDGACPHLAVAMIEFAQAGTTRGETMDRLRAAGIGAQVHYIPVHRQPYYRALDGNLSLPGAEHYYARCLSLPLFADMVEADVARVADALGEALGL